ncbi:MAG TPA: urea carboxylase-associated family protein [Gaiellales bacterium]|nr:urea carboxylase-associated family protein [Gaiellales bacterium]
MLIAPGTGLALPVRRGEVLRVRQLRGNQVVDVNAFAMGDARVRFGASGTRSRAGLSVGLGDVLWSAAPVELPLLTLIGDTAGGRHDVSHPACSELEYRLASGCAGHTNCCDIQAEAIRPWRLDAWQVHDPLNLWMESGERDGALTWRSTRTEPGDHVELLAHLDVLVSLNPCGDDLFGSSAFEVAPVAARVRRSTAAETRRWLAPEAPLLLDGRRPRLDRRVRPRWRLAPLRRRDLQVELGPGARRRLAWLRRDGRFGSADGEILRAVVWHWWAEHHTQG